MLHQLWMAMRYVMLLAIVAVGPHAPEPTLQMAMLIVFGVTILAPVATWLCSGREGVAITLIERPLSAAAPPNAVRAAPVATGRPGTALARAPSLSHLAEA